ncbi:MAG: VCBS repeat-containing protein [Pirellulaceae bacterium]|nr:VCBS repeat-containing protein [Pirellulaceae bacterium]
MATECDNAMRSVSQSQSMLAIITKWLRRLLIWAGVIVGLLVIAGGAKRVWLQMTVGKQFTQLDSNGDGKLTHEEVPATSPFNAWDREQYGVVTSEQFIAYHARRPAEIGATEPTGPAATDTLFRRTHIPGLCDIAEGTNGIALADLNQDGLVDIIATYTEKNRGLSNTGHHLRTFINQGGLRFRSHPITVRDSKLTGERFGAFPQIPNLVDFNGDGLLDIFISRHSPYWASKPRRGIEPLGNTLLLSDGAWDTFRDVSERLNVQNHEAYNRQSSIADVNSDGWLDIAIGCDNVGDAIGGVSHSRMYVFQPNGEKIEAGKFDDIGGTDRVPDFGGFYHDSAKDKAGPGISLRDLDNDGDVDLVQSFHCDVRQPLLPYSPGEYRQGVFCWKNLLSETGQLRFEKISGNGLACEASLQYKRDKQIYEPVGKAPGLPYMFFADVDNDGLQDVLAIGPSDIGFAPRAEDIGGRFWRNKGSFQFEEATNATGLEALNWDYREWYRFFEIPIPPALEKFRPKSLVTQPGRKQNHPLDERFYFANANFGDFNNDGWIDLLVLDRHESPSRPAYSAALFLNRGDGTFELKPTTISGLDSTGISSEIADLNNDGLLDIVIACDPDNSGGGIAGVAAEKYQDKVYVNTGAHGARENHWLHLTFTGLKDAELIGARVELTAGGRKQYRWIHSNHSYKSGGALDAHFGLGKHDRADLTVALLNGKSVKFADVRTDRFLDLNLKTQTVSILEF